MLVLSRKLSERIYIGEGPNAICITLVEIDRNKVRIGIEAPREVKIFREELLPVQAVVVPPVKCNICSNQSCAEPNGKH